MFYWWDRELRDALYIHITPDDWILLIVVTMWILIEMENKYVGTNSDKTGFFTFYFKERYESPNHLRRAWDLVEILNTANISWWFDSWVPGLICHTTQMQDNNNWKSNSEWGVVHIDINLDSILGWNIMNWMCTSKACNVLGCCPDQVNHFIPDEHWDFSKRICISMCESSINGLIQSSSSIKARVDSLNHCSFCLKFELLWLG